MECVVRHFEEELEGLVERLLSMGGLAEERGWKHVEIPASPRDAAEAAVAVGRGEPPADLSGIAITTHEKCEPLLLLFDGSGVLRNPPWRRMTTAPAGAR